MVGVRGILHCLGPASGLGAGLLAGAFSASLSPPFPAAADLCFVLVWDSQPRRLLAPSSGPERFCLYLPQKQSVFAHGLVPAGLPSSPPEAGKYCFCSSPEFLLGLWQQEQSCPSPIISLRAFALKAPEKSTVSFLYPRSTQLTPVPSVELLYGLLPMEEGLGMRAHSPCVRGSWMTGPYSACGNVSVLADLLRACMTATSSSCSATAETVYVNSLLERTGPS